MLQHDYHCNAGRLIDAVDAVDGICSSPASSLDDGRTVAVRREVDIARGIDARIRFAAADCDNSANVYCHLALKI
jgi:hypothetical protein